jgi:acetyl-CoA acyltransferase 1
LSVVLKELLLRVNLPTSFIGDIAVGNVLQPGAGATMSRMAMFEAGFPDTVPVYAVNRQCASGLQSIASIAASISSGFYDCGIAAGVESMTHSSPEASIPIVNWKTVKQCKGANDCTISMGITSENIAKRFQISRLDQDKFSFESHIKATNARKNGQFKAEIVTISDIYEDDGIRENTTLEVLRSLKPAFIQGGTATAGNSSQVFSLHILNVEV